jgi:DNA polymerase III epsilon subunit-like protein
MNKSIPPPYRHSRVLVFDVETTGLFNQKSSSIKDQPYILQLAFVCYDLNENKIIQKYDSLIDIPNEVEISDFITQLTGIDKTTCQKKGKPIFDVLRTFQEAYMWCDSLIGHNIDFDQKLILMEIERNREQIIQEMPQCLVLFSPMYEKMNHVERYCTMRKGTTLCNLVHETPPSPPTQQISIIPRKTTKKWPKLSELYAKLFPEETLPANLHNAMTDVIVCLQCYLKMRLHYTDENCLKIL